ncbi:MAG: TIM barrel protein [Planctomycetota bacterium]
MFVSAALDCFPDLSHDAAVEALEDLEFATVDVDLRSEGGHVPIDMILSDMDQAVQFVRHSHRLDIGSYSVYLPQPEPGLSHDPSHYDAFKEICRMGKATKVVTLTVPSSPLGTPFNEEVEHLKKLVEIAETEGVRVAVRSMIGCLSEDPDTLMVFCDNVDGLGITLDPSVYVTGPAKNKSLDRILKYVFHVELRDSSPEEFQVPVGRGEVEYMKIINQLAREGYDRGLCVFIQPDDSIEHRVELRKLRRLLETMI